MPGALDGVRVLDLAQGVAGPYAAMLLAEQGAQVLKIEPPTGDRLQGAAAYVVLNRSKQITSVDGDTPDGRRQITAQARAADVVIVDLPEPMARARGVDYDHLSTENPGLVYLWMPPFGGRGPLADRDADETLIAARCGITGAQFSGSDQPVDVVLPLTGYGAALLGVGAVCAALFERTASGLGQRVEVSGAAGAMAMQTGSMLLGPSVERLAGTMRNPLGGVPVYRLYQAGDGSYLFIAAGTPRFFQQVCLLLDHPEWISDERWSAAPWGILNPEHQQQLADEIAPIIASAPRAEWLRRLTEAGIPNAPVATRDEFIDHPQTHALNMRLALDDAHVGPTVQMGTPLTMHGTPGPAPRGAEFGVRSSEFTDAPSDPDSSSAVHSPPQQTNRELRTLNAEPGTPLAGVRVLDLSGFIAGAYCPMTLADFGADVVKVESPDGDAFRSFGLGFLGWNRGKRGLCVDARTTEGRAVILDLARTADVVVENFKPGGAARLGLDYGALAAVNPRIIYSSVSGFGAVGPEAGAPGFDPLLQARSGAMAAQGGMEQGHPPVFLQVAICDYVAALLSVYGICAALVARERTGVGQRVETTLVQSAMAAQAGEFIWYANRPPLAQGMPARPGSSAVRRVYRAADDRWLMLAINQAAQWPALRSVLPLDALADVDAETAMQAPPRGDLADALARAFAVRPVSEWLTLLEHAGVPAVDVLRPPELFTDPLILENDLLAAHEHPLFGSIRQTGVLAKFGRTPGTAQRVAPLLGQHSRAVLREAGFSEQRIHDLLASGVVIETAAG